MPPVQATFRIADIVLVTTPEDVQTGRPIRGLYFDVLQTGVRRDGHGDVRLVWMDGEWIAQTVPHLPNRGVYLRATSLMLTLDAA